MGSSSSVSDASGNKKKDANLPGMGGVFNPVDLDAYHYAGLNPMKFVDPDGEKTVLIFNFLRKKWFTIKDVPGPVHGVTAGLIMMMA